MSLRVDVFVTGADDKMQVLDVPDGCSDLAGFESWRTTVWGSPAVRSLGATFFPQLAQGDLYVAADEVPGFVAECALLRGGLELVARRADGPVEADQRLVEQVSQRLANIEAAAVRARAVGAGVVIW